MKVPLSPAALILGLFGLVSTQNAAVTQTQPETFTGTYSPTLTESAGDLLYGATVGGVFSPTYGGTIFSSVTGGTTITPTQTIAVPIAASNLRAGVFSLYNTGSLLVSITLDTAFVTTNSVVGKAFNAVFTTAGFNDETTLGTNILTAASGSGSAQTTAETYLTNFFTTYSADFPTVPSSSGAVSGTIVNFSNATLGGVVGLSFTPVPEPRSGLLLLMGAGVLGAGWLIRRRALTD